MRLDVAVASCRFRASILHVGAVVSVAPEPLHRALFSTNASAKQEEPMGELIDKAKGKIKQAAGDLTDDDKLKGEGKVDEAKGKVKGGFEELKHAVKDGAGKDAPRKDVPNE
jgi:uncharacterized protein YjbJ (UPF0337 family)